MGSAGAPIETTSSRTRWKRVTAVFAAIVFLAGLSHLYAPAQPDTRAGTAPFTRERARLGASQSQDALDRDDVELMVNAHSLTTITEVAQPEEIESERTRVTYLSSRTSHVPRPVYNGQCYPSELLTSYYYGLAECDAEVDVVNANTLVPPASRDEAKRMMFSHCLSSQDLASARFSKCPTYRRDFQFLKTYREVEIDRRSKGRWTMVKSSDVFEVMYPPTDDPPRVKFQPFRQRLGDHGTYLDPWAPRGTVPCGDVLREEPFTWFDTVAPPSVTEANLSANDSLIALPEFLSAPVPTLPYDVAIILPTLTTCMSNLFHGTFEYVLTTFQALRAIRALHPRATKVLLLVRIIQLQTYGVQNSRCEVLNKPPYGFGPGSSTYFMFEAMAKAFKRLDFAFYGENWRRAPDRHTGGQIINATFTADHVYKGAPVECFSFMNSFESGLTFDIDEYPMIKSDSHCSKVLRQFRSSVLLSEGVKDPGAVSSEEARCPHVMVISRAGRQNGRGLTNETEFVESVRRAVLRHSTGMSPDAVNCGRVTVVALETMSKKEQLALLQTATVLVGTRGAGLVMGLFLRPGSGMTTFSPWRDRYPLHFEDATVPWVPWGFIVSAMHVVNSYCIKAPPGSGALHHNLCSYVSANYCRMECNPRNVHYAIRLTLTNVFRGATGSPQDPAHTSFLMPVPHMTKLTKELKVGLGISRRFTAPRSANMQHRGPLRFIVWQMPTDSMVAFFESDDPPAEIVDATTDTVFTYTGLEANGLLEMNYVRTFNRIRLSQLDRIHRFARSAAPESLLEFAVGPQVLSCVKFNATH
jgi:hypothetical protein